MQKSGIDTIKYHTLTGTPYGKVTKTQENITYKWSKRGLPFPNMWSQGCMQQKRQNNKDKDKTQITEKIHNRITALEWSVKILEDFNMFNGTKLTLNSDVDQDT